MDITDIIFIIEKSLNNPLTIFKLVKQSNNNQITLYLNTTDNNLTFSYEFNLIVSSPCLFKKHVIYPLFDMTFVLQKRLNVYKDRLIKKDQDIDNLEFIIKNHAPLQKYNKTGNLKNIEDGIDEDFNKVVMNDEFKELYQVVFNDRSLLNEKIRTDEHGKNSLLINESISMNESTDQVIKEDLIEVKEDIKEIQSEEAKPQINSAEERRKRLKLLRKK